MSIPTLQLIKEYLLDSNLEKQFKKAFGARKAKTMLYGNKKNNYQSDTTDYALMFNIETEDLFFLNYASKGNGWAETAQSQNPWIIVGYVSALDIVSGNAENFLIDNIKHKIEEITLQEEMWNNHPYRY